MDMVLESLLCKRSVFCSNNIHPFCSRQICTAGQEYLVVYWSRISVLDITKCQLPCLVNAYICNNIDIVHILKHLFLFDFLSTDLTHTIPRGTPKLLSITAPNAKFQKLQSQPGKTISWAIKVVFFVCFLLALSHFQLWPLLYFLLWRGKIISETQMIPLGQAKPVSSSCWPNNPDWMADG